MTRSRDTGSAAVQVRQGDRWISRTAASTVAGLAGIAGALSYSHMRQLAQDHGQVGWHAHAFPLSVDGIEIVASLVLLADRRAGRRSGWLPWTALAAGTAGSLAANIAAAHPDPVSRVIAGWPALALLLAVKLLAGILERPLVPDTVGTAGGQASDRATSAISIPVPAGPSKSSASGHLATEVRPGPAPPLDNQLSSPPPAPGPAPGSRETALLSAARAARDELCQDGIPLTRDALAALLRRHGHPIRNASITPLLRQLRHEQPASHRRLSHGRAVPSPSQPADPAESTAADERCPPTRPRQSG
jgi:Protein of unknown function (DUF2637)